MFALVFCLTAGKAKTVGWPAEPAEADPFAQLMNEGLRRAMVAAIDKLPEREKTVMGLYYEQELNLRASRPRARSAIACPYHRYG